MEPIRPIAPSAQCPSGGPSSHRGPPWAIRTPPARIIGPNILQLPTLAYIGPHQPHIEPISYHCVLHLHMDPPSLQRVRGLVSTTLPFFLCYAFLCLNLILQPYNGHGSPQIFFPGAGKGPATLQEGKGVTPPHLGRPPSGGKVVDRGPRHPRYRVGRGTIRTFGGRRVRGLGGS